MHGLTRRGLLAAVLAALTLRPARAAAGQRWRCTNNDCDPYIYDPALGDPDNINGQAPIPPGTAFEDLPDDWICPLCGEPKRTFVRWHPPT